MLMTLFVAASLLGQAPTLPEETEVKYDKFHDSTMIILGLDEFTTEAGTHLPDIYTHHKGKEPVPSAFVTFGILRYGKHWEYLKHHDVFIMCGEQRLKINKTSYESEVDSKDPDNPCNEHFHIRVMAPLLEQMLELDRDLEVKIGTHKPFTIGPKSRDKMLQFVKAVRSGAY
jgi:hypothetical protein